MREQTAWTRRRTAVLLAALTVLATAAWPSTVTAGRLKPPKNTTLPVVVGSVVSGESLAVTPGTWSNSPATPYAYEWLRCDSAGSGCTTIAGATGSTYLVQALDVGRRLRLRETATNSVGSTSATSAATALVVAAAAPANTAPPSITGEAVVGETLTTSRGAWTGAPEPGYTVQWRRCNPGCAAIDGATSSTYTVAADDVGVALEVLVTAMNTSGSAAATSAPTPAVVAASPPSSTAPPVISGTPQVGATLSTTTGTWSGAPTPKQFLYAWQRCAPSCTPIAGANAPQYDVTASDAGANLAVLVTATNRAGSGSASSAEVGPVPAAPTTEPSVAAAGDIACDPTSSSFNGGLGTSNSCRQKAVSDLLVGGGYSAVLALGDNQYYCAGLSAFQQAYDPSWGRVKPITRPSVGNHEYLTSGGTGCDASNAGAAGYWDYFGSAAGTRGQGWYSFDVGGWHLIALNSNCSSAGGCSTTSPQGQWLKADLAAHPASCTLAFWHIPLFSSGGRAASNSRTFWEQLYAAGADVVLSGHDHIYERFAPQTPAGVLDTSRGIRAFIVGTGGANHTSLASTAANSELRDTTTYGVLKLTLRPNGYDWRFVPEAGRTFSDSGTAACHA